MIDLVRRVGEQGEAYVDYEARQPAYLCQPLSPLLLDTDMIRVICGLDPDVELMRAVTRQIRWRDPRRPRYLTDQQRALVEDHPELEEARRNLGKICAQYMKRPDNSACFCGSSSERRK